MNLVILVFKPEFKRILRETAFEQVGKILTRLEGKHLFLDYNDIDVIPNSDKVSFLSLDKNVTIEMKIGRFINKLLTDANVDIKRSAYNTNPNLCTPYDIERFVYLWKGFSNFQEMSKSFELVTGEDIRKFYHEKNYERGGTLGNSCMKYVNCQKYLDIYCINPDQIGMLILKGADGKIKGRAIVWKNINMKGKDEDKKNKVFLMDRIYSVEESIVEMFKIYAKNMGWVYKFRQEADEDGNFVMNGELIDRPKFSYYLTNLVTSKYFPFMDSLTQYSLINGFISNRRFKDCVTLGSTDGTYYR